MKKKILIALLVFLLIPVLLFSIFISRLKISGTDILAKEVNKNEPVNVLLLGVDAGNNSDEDGHKRSDTMMLLNYRPKDNKVSIVSIPRDTRVIINNKYSKINSAHAYGGPKLAINSVEKLLKIDVNYYVEVDFSGFRKCIDAIGGIDVVIERDMDFDQGNNILKFNKGEAVHLDGEKAEAFVRWRKNQDGDGYAMGDLGRIDTQQQFMVMVFEKLKTTSGKIRIPILLDTASKYVKTNIPVSKMLYYLTKLNKINGENIERKLLGGEAKYIGNVSYFIFDEKKSAELLKDLRENKSKTANVEKGEIRIRILNATGVNGLASKYRGILKDLGYNVINIGNNDKLLSETIIRDYSNLDYGDILAVDIGGGSIVKEKGKESFDLTLILGKDMIK